MGERRACPWWWWGWPRRRRRARRLLSRRRVPRRQLSRRRLSRWRLSRRRFSRQRLSRREGVRRQAGLRRQAVLPASWVLRARRVRRGGAGLRRRLLVRPALLRVPVSLFVSVHGTFVYARVYARLYPAWTRAASILVLVRRSRRLLPLRPELRGRLAAGSASAPARVLTRQRSSRDAFRPERRRDVVPTHAHEGDRAAVLVHAARLHSDGTRGQQSLRRATALD